MRAASSDDRGPTVLVTDHGRYELEPGREYLVGRGDDVDISLSDLRVSRRHARLAHESGSGWILEDLGSRSGTFADGSAVRRHHLDASVELRLADPTAGPRLTVRDDRRAITIGRTSVNDLVLDDLLVSRRHAIVRATGDGWELEDLGSANGTFVGGMSVERAPLADGQSFAVGPRLLRLRDGHVEVEDDVTVPALRCLEAGVVVPSGPRILDDVSFVAEHGTMTAVLGPTGAGKSTLLKVLTGARRPTEGQVLISGRDLHAAPAAIRPLLGYVPQDDIIHPQLTIRQALRFAAALRLPPDVTEPELDGRIAAVLDELGLAERADVRVQHLSGGQRKRTSVALELLTAPDVLVLDEPTSGLDPGYERSVMQLLRNLADAGRTVVVVTHSVQSLALCDQVLLLASGGRAAYLGPPEGVLPAFGCDGHAGVFQALERGERGAVAPSPPADAPVVDESIPTRSGPPDPRDPHDRERWFRQLATLVHRQRAVIAGDRRVAAFFVAAVLVPGLLVRMVVERGALAASSDHLGSEARTLLGALVVTAVTIGCANTVREIVKERAIAERDRAAGVADSAYLASKLLVLGAITVLQVLLLVAIGSSASDGPQGSATWLPGWLELTLGVVLAALGAATLGLLLSSLVSSSEKAMALVSTMFVVQWLLSGVALDLADTPAIRPVSYVTSANWGMAAVASTANLARLEGNCGYERAPADDAAAPEDTRSCDARWARGAWRWLGNVAMLIVLAIAPLPGVLARLRRLDG